MKKTFQLTRSGFAFALLLPLLLMLPFQNCTKTKFGSEQSDSPTKSSNSGGNYDGKPYIHSEPTQPCSGGNAVRSVIVYKEGKFTLVKHECAPVSPTQELAASDIQTDGTRPAILTYKSKKFIFDTTTVLANPADLTCVKKNFGPVESLKIYLIAGPSGTMMSGLLLGNGKSTVLAFDKTSLDTSSGSVLSGQSQDGDISASLSRFDPSNPYPDGTNTAITFGYGTVGSNSYLSCTRPGGGL